MTSTEKIATAAPRPRTPGKVFTAKEKAQAVLSVWSGRRKPSAVSKVLGVNWAILNMWEKMAIVGILKALGAEEQELAAQQGLNLGSRLERLLTVPEQVAEVPATPKEA